MASAIASVTGPVAAADLGHVLVHEHVVCGAAGVTRGAASLAGGRRGARRAGGDGPRRRARGRPHDDGRCDAVRPGPRRRAPGRGVAPVGVTILAATGHWLLPSVFMSNRSVAGARRPVHRRPDDRRGRDAPSAAGS